MKFCLSIFNLSSDSSVWWIASIQKPLLRLIVNYNTEWKKTFRVSSRFCDSWRSTIRSTVFDTHLILIFINKLLKTEPLHTRWLRVHSRLQVRWTKEFFKAKSVVFIFEIIITDFKFLGAIAYGHNSHGYTPGDIVCSTCFFKQKYCKKIK